MNIIYQNKLREWNEINELILILYRGGIWNHTKFVPAVTIFIKDYWMLQLRLRIVGPERDY